MIRKKTVFFLLVLILGTVLPAAEAATPVQPLPDDRDRGQGLRAS